MTSVKGSADVYNDLIGKLPASLIPSDIECKPEFSKLLKSLTQRLLPNGASTTSQQDVQQAKELLRRQKQRWMLHHTLYTELHELLLDQQLQAQKSQTANTEFYSAVSEMLTQSEIVDYTNCSQDATNHVKLLGLSADELSRLSSKKMQKQSMQQKVIPDVESRLRRRCELLVTFHDSTQCQKPGSSRLEFAKAAQLPSVIANELQQLENEKLLMKKEVTESHKLQSQYCQLLMESFKLLNRLIVDHRMKSQPENDSINSEWLAARCDALCLKIKVLNLQLMYDTYYAETVDALRTIRSELDKSISDTERELRRCTAALQAYESVGSGFDTIVQEFTQLRSDIDNRRWALHELKKCPTSNDADRTLFS